MIVNEKYKVHWEHHIDITYTTNKKGNKIIHRQGYSQCFITSILLNTVSDSGLVVHIVNKFDRKKGLIESFKAVVSRCPSKELRLAFWTKFWEIRKPTITVTEETADLLACADYVHCIVKKVIVEDGELKHNEEWRTLTRPDFIKTIGIRLSMYRDKSDYSLIAIIKFCIMGFINFKRLKDETIPNKSNK